MKFLTFAFRNRKCEVSGYGDFLKNLDFLQVIQKRHSDLLKRKAAKSSKKQRIADRAQWKLKSLEQLGFKMLSDVKNDLDFCFFVVILSV